MTPLSIAMAVHAIPTLLWSVIAWECWCVRFKHPRPTLFLLLALVSTFFAAHMVLHLFDELARAAGGPIASRGALAIEFATATLMIATAPTMLHALRLIPVRPNPPSRAWLAGVYGSAVVAFALYAARALREPAGPGHRQLADIIAYGYVVVAFGLALVRSRPHRRGRVWLQGLGIAQLRLPELVLLALALVFASAMLAASWHAGDTTLSAAGALFSHTAAALLFALPFVVRMMGRVVRSFLVTVILLPLAALAFVGAHAIASAGSATTPALSAATGDMIALGLLFLVLVPIRTRVALLVDRMVFRRSRELGAELQAAANRLSPADGIDACCRAALATVCGRLRLSGGAIVLTRGRGAFGEGLVDLPRLVALWPADRAAEIADRPMMEIDLRDLPDDLRTAVTESDVSRLVPIASPRRRWGHLFAVEPLFTAPIDAGELEMVAAFLHQLALVLDAYELLEHAVEVERSLAHAEKLAAIGELSARVAHEIRNPVTAARSLAQLLARHPDAPDNAENAELILTELERVERQIASLLRFARREEYRFAPTDVAELVRSAVADLRPRLDDAGVAVDVDVDDGGLTARVDAEKLRQVVINLVENARDALATADGDRRLRVAARRSDGVAHLRIADTGPGIPPAVLARVFEPFFSLKENGTGLGLAIVKRTVEAHGGRIAAENAAGGGAVFAIDLPLERNA